MNSPNSVHIAQFCVTNGALINYCYLVIDLASGKGVAIDPAWDIHVIEGHLAKYRVSLCGVLVTHNHSDHIDLAPALASTYDCNIYMSDIEYNYYNIDLERIVLLKDRSTFTLGDINILPIFTPGHTAGSTCYLVNNALFTGDTLFNEGTGICSTDGGNPVEMFHSIQTLKQMIPNNTVIYPGHRYYSDLGMTFGNVKKNNIYLQIEDMDQFVKFRMRENKKLFAFS